MSHELMTTREVADYLRIKERKVYDLVRERKIPCSRVTGKWLFPKALIDLWVAQNSEPGPDVDNRAPAAIVAGSHDPLLDWAVRESRCGLAMLPGGSLDGLHRVAAGEAMLAGIHVREADGTYNVGTVRNVMPRRDYVILEWAKREQGLVVAQGNPLGLRTVADLRVKKARVVLRQPEAGSQILLVQLLASAGLSPDQLTTLPNPALSENDLGLAIAEGKADAGVAVRAVANQFRLGFVPLQTERFDLVMRRRDYFQPPVQKLFAFSRTPGFHERAADLGGYDVGELGQVIYNS
ncbi:MAG TPA: helix-turn-helix transcriptional regulator [Alphaproteobacteria bacterium]